MKSQTYREREEYNRRWFRRKMIELAVFVAAVALLSVGVFSGIIPPMTPPSLLK